MFPGGSCRLAAVLLRCCGEYGNTPAAYFVPSGCCSVNVVGAFHFMFMKALPFLTSTPRVFSSTLLPDKS